ncbi:hypothetical protein HPULCUR_010176 [Helicostylum pulchrum]|uniref:Nudix hydrolase domain-containing protein n=1 Tax=Helicostylum pulchrum TaxID=562976 RepID=A0ABP9YCI7_9FUNG
MPVFENLLQVVSHCDTFPYTLDPSSTDEIHHAVPFTLGPYTIGNVLPSVIPHLINYNKQENNFLITSDRITFHKHINTPQKRSDVVKQLMDTWRANNTFDVLSGWRNELYPVYGDDSQPDNIAFVIERASAALFGISTFGVHLNAYTRENGQILVWIARRALTKPTWPGLLDNCVAGGISYTYSVKDTIVKECEEEASIPFEVANKARSVNVISYFTYSSGGLQPETEYIYDLKLPQDFKPKPRDGEVDCFYLWPLDKVKETLLNNEWKPNCALVMIDFMIRHSFVTPDEESDFIDISYRLHRRLEFPTPRKGN